MIPRIWIVLGCALAICGSTAVAYVKGRSDGRAVEVASQAKEEHIRMETRELAQQAAAEAIAKIEVNHTTIRQRAETITREVPVYRDCINDPAVERLLDDARANRAPTDSVGDSKLP